MPDTLECLTRYIDALRSRDFSNVPFDPDVTFEGPLLGKPLKGKDPVVDFLKQVTERVSDIRVKQHVVQGSHACAVFQFRGGFGMVIEACDYFEVSDKGIAEIRVFFGTVPSLFPLMRIIVRLRRAFS